MIFSPTYFHLQNSSIISTAQYFKCQMGSQMLLGKMAWFFVLQRSPGLSFHCTRQWGKYGSGTGDRRTKARKPEVISFLELKKVCALFHRRICSALHQVTAYPKKEMSASTVQ